MDIEEDRLTLLETKLAYLEDFLGKVQEVTIEQGKEIRQLRSESNSMRNKLSELLDTLNDMPNVKPPHY